MKRQGHLIERIAEMENLRLAFWKVRRGKEEKQEVIRFCINLEMNLVVLQKELLDGRVVIGDYHCFPIFDSKERMICASSFRERVLHHALMNVCHDNFEHYQMYHSYASRKGKGVHAAIKQAQINQHKYKWFLKMDVHKYFDSIDHEVLKRLLEKRFKDERLLGILCSIIDSYSVVLKKGLPIGSLMSQYFANYYLGIADHYLEEQLKAKAFVRYMDDVVVWDHEKEPLKVLQQQYQLFLEKELHLVLNPSCLNNAGQGLSFCGYRIFADKMHLSRVSKKRFIEKFNRYECLWKATVWNDATYQRHLLPLLACTEYADCWGLRKSLIKEQNYK